MIFFFQKTSENFKIKLLKVTEKQTFASMVARLTKERLHNNKQRHGCKYVFDLLLLSTLAQANKVSTASFAIQRCCFACASTTCKVRTFNLLTKLTLTRQVIASTFLFIAANLLLLKQKLQNQNEQLHSLCHQVES
jgi:hypothetical protein